jgi:hypothetical protein
MPGLDFDNERRESVGKTGSRVRAVAIDPDGEELRSWT